MTPTPRRAVLAAAVAAAAGGTAAVTVGLAHAGGSRRAAGPAPASTIGNRAWATAAQWREGTGEGTAVLTGPRPGLTLARPAGTLEYADPHTGTTRRWEYATWTSPEARPAAPATELIPSWNAETPAGTWLRAEVRATYTDGAESPWYTLGVWASGDGDIRRTSVDGQGDGRSTVWTDTLAVDDPAGPLLAAYRLRLTLCRAPGGSAAPTVRRAGAMTSALPDRFEVPATAPGPAAGTELVVPRYSQNVHLGRYPEYDNGGEAWCSPTSSQMIVESWGHRPSPEDLAWVDPSYSDPQVCHAARRTFDWGYQGCGNWPFNAAYAATHHGLRSVVTRLAALTDAERLVAAGIPLITSQSFHEAELEGAGYGTSGHLMTVVGFTAEGDVIANDPAAEDNAGVRRVYPRRAFENVWLRTRRLDEQGRERSGTGGVCYLYFPGTPTAAQRRALASVGVR
ncbi:peptidase C39 family protein [Streptomyces sp. DSM 44917]|uniref:Peptidase C39 family protein n=1 Tax=Streptomyces boetiae TaxID=3075541 RepID=A0ABU2LCY1_9ACTN|nr:peptidase C39 family protein [Streptomyces sp. DSM 44917]MDT0309430.1 peptidase C39 family protein [Streptomyces sp. DSM 44917]